MKEKEKCVIKAHASALLEKGGGGWIRESLL